MPNTPSRSYPYPATTVAPAVPQHMQQLATAIDTDIQAFNVAFNNYSTPVPRTVTYQAGWVTYSTLTASTLHGRCRLDGLARHTSVIPAGGYVHVATLPAGSRPATIRVFAVSGWISGSPSEHLPRASVYIDMDGRIYLYPESGLTGAFLDGISFPVA